MFTDANILDYLSAVSGIEETVSELDMSGCEYAHVRCFIANGKTGDITSGLCFVGKRNGSFKTDIKKVSGMPDFVCFAGICETYEIL